MGLMYHDGFDRGNQAGADPNQTGIAYAQQQGWPGIGSFGNGMQSVVGRRAGGRACGIHAAIAFPYQCGCFDAAPKISADRATMKSIIVGAAFLTDDTTRDIECLDVVDDGYGIKVAVRWLHATKNIQVKDSTGTVVATTAADSCDLADWHYIEVQATRHSSTGTIQVWVDDVRLVNLTGQNTGDEAYGFTAVEIGPGSGRFDDFYIIYPDDGVAPTARLGSSAASVGFLPTADSAVDFTPDTGSTNYSRLTADMDFDSSYVQTSTEGDTDLYEFGDIGDAAVDAVVAATVMTQCRRPSGGSARLASLAHVGGTTYADSNRDVVGDSGFKTIRWTKALNPATAAAWTQGDLEAATFGYRSADQTDPLRVTSCHLEVLFLEGTPPPPPPPPATVTYAPSAEADALVALDSLLDVRATAEADVAFSIAAPAYYVATVLLDAWSTESIPTTPPPDFSYVATGEAFVRYVGESPEVTFYTATAEADATFDVDGVSRFRAVAVASARVRRLSDGRVDLLVQDVYPR